MRHEQEGKKGKDEKSYAFVTGNMSMRCKKRIMKPKGIRYSLQILFFTIAVVWLSFLCLETEANAVVHDHFFVVHCEVMDEKQIDRQFHGGLEPLVQLADIYGIKLTLSLSPQWAEYLIERPWLLYEIKYWLNEGHEIGILHYGIRHEPEWDYYTNETDPQAIILAGRNPDQKKGSMVDLINIMNTFFALPIIQSPPAKQLSMNQSDYLIDLEPGTSIQYLTGGSRISNNPLAQDVITKPEENVLYGQTYKLLSMGAFVMSEDTDCVANQLLPDLHALYEYLKNLPPFKDDPDYKFGLVTHPLHFMRDNPRNGGCGYIEKWFRFISTKISAGEVSPRTVSEILDDYSVD